jgi:hypothetical protein
LYVRFGKNGIGARIRALFQQLPYHERLKNAV